MAALRQAVYGYIPSANTVKAAHRQQLQTRRRALATIYSPIIVSTAVAFSVPVPSVAITKAQSTAGADVPILKEATEALSSLLDNWQKATTDCTYADVPRELLETKNKEKLLEKASEFALFDKSTSVVSCKRINRVVRDYIGATGKGPLVGAEKRLLRKNVVEEVEPDSLDEYFSAVELFSQSISRATSLSYTAGTADFDSMNNFAKGEENGDGSDNLEQAREAIQEANISLKKAVSFLADTS